MGHPKVESIQRVVAATDFSVNGGHAVDWGIDLAAAHGSELTIYFAMGSPETLEREIGVSLPVHGIHGQLRKLAAERLEDEVLRAKEAGVSARCVMEVGSPASSILRFAAESKTDMIVIGTRGHTGFDRLVMGSTAEVVVQKAPCSVFVVHPGDPIRERSQWTVLVPTDFSKDAAAALEAATRLPGSGCGGVRYAGGLRIILMHICVSEPELYGLLPLGSDIHQEAMERYERQDMGKLDEIAEELRDRGFVVEVIVCSGYAPELIVEEAEVADVDFIAIGSHRHSALARMIFGSVADRVVRHAPCPVYAVHDPARDSK